MTANIWQKLTQRMNERTIKNPRMGAIPLVLETDVWPFDIIGQLDTSRWENQDMHGAPVRYCDAQAWFLTSDFVESEAKTNDRLICADAEGYADQVYIILSAEPKPDGITHVLLRKYSE